MVDLNRVFLLGVLHPCNPGEERLWAPKSKGSWWLERMKIVFRITCDVGSCVREGEKVIRSNILIKLHTAQSTWV